MTDDILALARRGAPAVSKNIGYNNVEFSKGRIQDFALDLEQFDKTLTDHPLIGFRDCLEAEQLPCTCDLNPR